MTMLINHDSIQSAALQAKQQGRRAIELLEQLTGLEPQHFTEQLATTHHYPHMALSAMMQLQPAFERISFSESLQRECVLLTDNSQLFFVFADIYNQALESWATERIDAPFVTYLAHHSDIAAYLAQQEDATRTVDAAITGAATGAQSEEALEELSLNMIEGDLSPVIKLVRSTLFDALKADASDIHLETQPQGLLIKYRLDGVLSQVGAVSEVSLAEQVISRIKVIAELDITEQRVPQDGRFRAVYRGRDVDFRVSVMPSIHGEDVVIRILDKQTLADKSLWFALRRAGF